MLKIFLEIIVAVQVNACVNEEEKGQGENPIYKCRGLNYQINIAHSTVVSAL